MEVADFIAKWSPSAASERANKDAFLLELCDVLEVPRPDPARGIPEQDTYVFERDAYLPREGGRGSIGKIDLYKEGSFLLEAKQGSRQESQKLGAARRGTPAWNIAMRDAFGQALGYARTLDPPPPFLIVCDIGYCFDLYIASSDAYHLGILSSRLHVVWALSAGGNLGVGNDPVYVKTLCFDPFPFPAATDAQAERVRQLGESLGRHRKARQAEHEDLELTNLYNVLEKERAGAGLSEDDREVHRKGLVSVLREIHDELDAAVAEAYGWSATSSDEEILEKLVALNAERAEEERNGHVRWLRPEFQAPEAAPSQAALPGAAAAEPAVAAAAVAKWPREWPERITAVHDVVSQGGEWTTEQVASRFRRARRTEVQKVLHSLTALGLAARFADDEAPRWQSLTRR